MGHLLFIGLAVMLLVIPGFAQPALPGNMDSMTAGAARMIGDQVALRCGRFELRFAADGRPLSLLHLPQKKQLLDTRNPGDGFVVTNRAGEKLPLSRLSLSPDGQRLSMTTAVEGPRAVFRLLSGTNHIGFSLESLDRFGHAAVPDLSLAFNVNCDAAMAAVAHNWMVTITRSGGKLEATWPVLWNVAKGDAPGGFSIYHKQNDDDGDEALLRIWAEAGIAHPAVDGTWTYERARDWVEKWMKRFGNPTGRIILEAKTPADLYKGLEYAQAAGCSEVYLMPWIWRGEYWPIKKTTAAINTDLFPRGEADLRAFAEKVSEMGMILGLHWVSAGIGFEDPVYIGKKPDRRLASWGAGTLEAAVDEKATTLRFRPAAGVAAPFNAPWAFAGSLNHLPALPHFQRYHIVRVEDELVRFDKLGDTEQPVWTLQGCARGYGSTDPAPHAAGADAAGLIVAYDRNVLPDNHSPLLKELATAYARLVNRCGIDRVEFDGLEIHRYHGGHGNKMAELLYAALDHPTMSNASNGKAPPAWFEYNLSRVRQVDRSINAAIARLRSPSHNASSLLMAHYSCFPMATRGSASVGLEAGDRGFYPADFERHGLRDAILTSLHTWRGIARAADESQRKEFILGHMRDPNARLRQAGNHKETPFVYVPEKTADGWAIYPTKVLDTGGQNSLWYWGQENGPIEPWRFIKPNHEHRWHNPFAAQPPRFILHVLPATDYDDPQNILFQPRAGQMRQVGDHQFADAPAGLGIARANPRGTEVWDEKNLPALSGSLPRDLSRHRAMGFWVDGDGGKGVLVLQLIGGRARDYAIPLDFVGKRYIEIPHGEAAYALGAWGWRFVAGKTCNYENISAIRLGFGYLPAQSEAKVTVSGLKALREIPVALKNPSLVTPAGTLRVRGEVPPDHYLEYQGGEAATLYDANWNKIGELPVNVGGATLAAGDSAMTVRSEQPGPLPWLEVQLLAHGQPILVKEKK